MGVSVSVRACGQDSPVTPSAALAVTGPAAADVLGYFVNYRRFVYKSFVIDTMG